MTVQKQINQQLATHAVKSTQNDTTFTNPIIKEIIAYLQLSSMKQKEKAMWLLLLPSMEEKHLLKLRDSLVKEVNSLTDLYLKALSNKI